MATSIEPVTVTFSEGSSGWVSFKSFIQDGGVSLNNQYYTFKNTTTFDTNTPPNLVTFDFLLWKHHANETRNNFYGQQSDSHVDVLFNEESATVKSFASMKYEGSQAKITQDLTDPAYFNNDPKPGWYVESGNTDLQLAGEMEFKNKEGKWFSYMKGKYVENHKDLNSEEFSFQGIDVLENLHVSGVELGCTDPNATNYEPSANTDDGSCTYPSYSCWECDGNGDCVEDTNFLNGPCNGYADRIECETLTNYCAGPPPSLYTLTINDSTPDQQQLNYSVSTFTKTGIIGDTVLPETGNVIAPGPGNWSEYKLEISADVGYTVRASDFGIEFPNGVTSVDKTTSSGPVSIAPSQYVYSDGDPNVVSPSYVFVAGGQSGAGLDLGTGPLVMTVVFTDSENIPNSNSWAGPTAANKVIVSCVLSTDMQDNIKGKTAGQTMTDLAVYMTHNGMQSTNSINAGIPGDLDIDINIIGFADWPTYGCTDPTAVNYSSSATVDDGTCHWDGCTDSLATNYNALAMVDDGSCVYPTVYGCTDNTQGISANWVNTDNRPEGYFGPAENWDPTATASCDDNNGPACVSAPFFSHVVGTQTGVNCCCKYDGCNEIIQSLDGTINVTHNTSATGNGGITYTINNFQQTSWVPSNNTITINIYDGKSINYVSNMQTNMFWNGSSNASGWGGMAPTYAVSSSSQGVVHTANSVANPSNWNVVGPSTTLNGLGLPVGDYHMRVDTGDDCFLWYDFTIEDSYTPPTGTYGCTDDLACNYNSLATIDDGTCTYGGCTDATAFNYDATVPSNCDDGSCWWKCHQPPVPTTVVDKTSPHPNGGPSQGSVTFTWDDMNGSSTNIGSGGGGSRCSVDGFKVRFRRVGTSSYSGWHIGGDPMGNVSTAHPHGSCNDTTTSLTAHNGYIGSTSATWEFDYRLHYCVDQATAPGANQATYGGDKIKFPHNQSSSVLLNWGSWKAGGTFTT